MPVVVAVVIAMLPAADGLPQHAWYYFAIFVAVILGLVLEPLPGGGAGQFGVTVAAVLAQPAGGYWRLGFIFGVILLAMLLAVATPWLFAIKS